LARIADDVKSDFVAYLDQNNQLEDPMLAGISHDLGEEALDPRPNNDSPLLGTADFSFSEGDDFFDEVSYRGAFLTDNWAAGWTALDQFGYFGDLQEEGVGTAVEDVAEVPSEISLGQNYPNPFNPSTAISFSLPQQTKVRLVVHDMLGRELKVLSDGTLSAGTHSIQFDAADLPSGMYIYRLETQEAIVAKKMLLLK
jgi:hypothetical protein